MKTTKIETLIDKLVYESIRATEREGSYLVGLDVATVLEDCPKVAKVYWELMREVEDGKP